jgi:hypothetical protein
MAVICLQLQAAQGSPRRGGPLGRVSGKVEAAHINRWQQRLLAGRFLQQFV